MKKIIIIGCTGMLGYNLYLVLNNKYSIYGTCRNKYNLLNSNIFEFEHTTDNLLKFINDIKPDIIINCIALLSEKSDDDKINMIYSNSILPIELNKICKKNKIYFIHFSTDAVFKSSEIYNDIINKYSPESFYGITKALSESIKDDCLILRICPIGHDKFKNKSLFNYIYSNNQNNINGFKNCYFNGLTTLEISNEIIRIIEDKYIYGIHHITGPKISKYNLLIIINEIFNLKKEINEIDNPIISRLLKDDLINSNNLNWYNMIKDLKIFLINSIN